MPAFVPRELCEHVAKHQKASEQVLPLNDSGQNIN